MDVEKTLRDERTVEKWSKQREKREKNLKKQDKRWSSVSLLPVAEGSEQL